MHALTDENEMRYSLDFTRFRIRPRVPTVPKHIAKSINITEALIICFSCLWKARDTEKKNINMNSNIQNKLCIKFETAACHLKVDLFLTDRRWHMITQYKEIKN